jgi:hypothetical protein
LSSPKDTPTSISPFNINSNTISHLHYQRHHHKVVATSPELHDVWVNVIGPKLGAADIVVLSSVSKWGHATAHSIMTHQGVVKWNADNLKDLHTLQHVWRNWPHLKMELDAWEDGGALKCLIAQPATATAAATGTAASDPSSSVSSSVVPQQPPSDEHVRMLDGVCRVAVLRLVWCPVPRFEFVEPSALEQFHRVGPKLGMEGRVSLESMLVKCTALRSLTLSNCIEEGDDVKWLANALSQLTGLTHLDLRCNYLEADRAETLAPTLAKLTSITSLDLGVNAFGAEGMQHLAPSLAKMSCMRELILQYNYMGAEGAKALAPSLAFMPHLTGLYLGENGMGAEGVQAIVPMLPHMPQLAHVNIEVRWLGPEARAGVRKMLPLVKEADLW